MPMLKLPSRSSATAAAAAVLAASLWLAGCQAPDTPEKQLAAASEALAQKKYADAVVRTRAALQLQPDNGPARLLLGQALMAAGDGAGAVLELNKALEQKVAPPQVVPALARALVMAGDYKRVTLMTADELGADQA
ncbi:MAG: tetratricopeptide repeat protein, partial [Rubrivivax sp.]|nr:tetratricopeptide repeat protein [Rubrivivax sp.]